MPDPLADLSRLDGVSSAIVSARDAVDAVLRDRGLRTVTAEQSRKALLTSARAGATLNGDPERWLVGSVRMATEIPALSTLILVSPAQAIARLHSLVALGNVAEPELGRVRTTAGVSERMVGLMGLLTGSTSASGIVLASVAHAEIASICPFGTADTLVALAVEHVVLIATGVDPRAVLVPAAGHLDLVDGYQSALAGYREGSLAGVREWLLHCTQALTYAAEASPIVTHGVRRSRHAG